MYNPQIFPFTQAKVNDDDEMVVDLKEGENTNYIYFDLHNLGKIKNWQNVVSVEFLWLIHTLIILNWLF